MTYKNIQRYISMCAHVCDCAKFDGREEDIC